MTVYAIEMQSRKPRTLLLPNGLACELFTLMATPPQCDLTTFELIGAIVTAGFDFEEARLRVQKSGKYNLAT